MRVRASQAHRKYLFTRPILLLSLRVCVFYTIPTVPSAKTVHLSLFHSLTLFSAILWVICTSKVSKLSPTSANQHGRGVKLSCDYHVTHLCAKQWFFKKNS